jgi:hypothetical protein
MKSYILKIIHDIWIKHQRITYIDFIELFSKIYPSDDSIHIPKQTFSRILHEFLQDEIITKYKNPELQTMLHEPIQEAIHKGIYGREEFINTLTRKT